MKYEYTIAVAYTPEGERQTLATMGADGWLLCAVVAGVASWWLYFARVVA